MVVVKDLFGRFSGVSPWKTSISWVEEDCIIVRDYNIENLIKDFSFSEIVFLLLRGDLPSKMESRMFEAVLVSFCDHGVTPPSTQAVRLASSSGSPLYASVAAGILAFGKNHAGAIEDCMKMLQKANLDNPEETAKEIVHDHLKNGRKVPGFGHRYHKRDPRAIQIIKLAKKYGCLGSHTKLAIEIEKTLQGIKGVSMNIDGANAAILSDLGFPWETGTGIFMIGRLPGLIAHAHEETQQKPFKKTIQLHEIQYQPKQKKDKS